METVGYLTGNDSQKLLEELGGVGAKNVDLTGTTMNQVGFGSPITLMIQGKITGQSMAPEGSLFNKVFCMMEYDFLEQKVSTAKH